MDNNHTPSISLSSSLDNMLRRAFNCSSVSLSCQNAGNSTSWSIPSYNAPSKKASSIAFSCCLNGIRSSLPIFELIRNTIAFSHHILASVAVSKPQDLAELEFSPCPKTQTSHLFFYFRSLSQRLQIHQFPNYTLHDDNNPIYNTSTSCSLHYSFRSSFSINSSPLISARSF